MATLIRFALSVPFLLAAGCAAGPAERSAAPAPLAAPLVMSSGMVIGTFSYQYVEVADGAAGPAWVVHFERVDAPASQDYAMVVDVDPGTRQGIFTGALPAGVYAFREAASNGGHYSSAVLKMPFEVTAGAVQDAGHYALDPLSGR
jgi:hypothetical protein